MIQIRNPKDLPVQLWKDDEYQGMIETYLQFLDIRLQIRNAEAVGYRFWINGEYIDIRSDGKIAWKPAGLFTKVDDYLKQLL